MDPGCNCCDVCPIPADAVLQLDWAVLPGAACDYGGDGSITLNPGGPAPFLAGCYSIWSGTHAEPPTIRVRDTCLGGCTYLYDCYLTCCPGNSFVFRYRFYDILFGGVGGFNSQSLTLTSADPIMVTGRLIGNACTAFGIADVVITVVV